MGYEATITPIAAALWLYIALGAGTAAGFVIVLLREERNPATRRKNDRLLDEVGVGRSAAIVLAGLVWPYVLGVLLSSRRGQR